MIIYKITNNVNQKIYIGQTIRTLGVRKSQHKTDTKNGGSLIHKSIKKHGINNFIFEIVHTCNSKKELNIMEKYYINKYNTFHPNGKVIMVGIDQDYTLYSFCKDNNLHRSTMSQVASGAIKHHRGYTCEKLI